MIPRRICRDVSGRFITTFRDVLIALAILAVLLPLVVVPAVADTPPGSATWFPFVIPWDDARGHVPTDASFLNGPIEPIIVKAGHFYGAKTGKRVRFIGVNTTFKANFPDHGAAEMLAAHLAKLGINIVRLHQLDNPWDPAGSIWDQTVPDRRHLSTTQMDKFDYFVAQLEKHGIYVDLNLHTTRKFTQADGFPADIDQVSEESDKRVDNFDATMIDREKEYAHDLVMHTNPYTGQTYAADPGVALMEINNENSLVGDPWATIGGGLDALPPTYRTELAGLWNAWLKQRYGSDAVLRAAWARDLPPAGISLTGSKSSWILELDGGANTIGNLTPSMSPASGVAPDAAIDIAKTDGIDWHVQSNISGLDLKEGQTYTISFQARSSAPRSIRLDVAVDERDWHLVGLSASVDLVPDWRTFRYTMTAKSVVTKHTRLDFVLGNSTGQVWISKVSVVPGIVGAGLQPGESVISGTVPLVNLTFSTEPQKDDWYCFLMDTERNYANEMRDYLKQALQVQACVVDSQLEFGGPSAIGRESSMDYADNHAYWSHPSFPHKPWDPADWLINNKSMTPAIATNGGALRSLAEYRVQGKPYTISEWNEPAPNDYQAETVPVLITFAAAQDWDGVMLFDYGDYGPSADTDRIQSFFDIGSNPAKAAFLPAAAVLFRAGLISPFQKEVDAYLPIVGLSRAKYLEPSDLWKSPPDILSKRIAVFPVTSSKVTSVPPPTETDGASSSSSTSIQMLGTSSQAVYVASSARGEAIVGFTGGHTIAAGSDIYSFDESWNNFASLLLAPMDSLSIEHSNHLLLTVMSRAENQQMGWNADRSSVGDNWGHPPVQAEDVYATVTIKCDAPRTVYALDPTGAYHLQIPSNYANGALTFKIGDAESVWYAIVKEEDDGQ